MGACCFSTKKELPGQILEKLALVKAISKGRQDELLLVLELYAMREYRDILKSFGDVLHVLWENEILEDEAIEAWHGKEDAIKQVEPQLFVLDDATAIRASSAEFLYQMRQY